MKKAQAISPVKAPPSPSDLDSRKASMERQIASLRARYAQAVIDGTEFDSGALRNAEDELAAIIAAQQTLRERESERARQEALAAEKMSIAERNERAAKGLEQLENARLEEVEKMDAAARAFADAFENARDLGKQLHASLISRRVQSSGLTDGEFERRIGAGLSAKLAARLDEQRLGEITLMPGVRDPNLPWIEVEQNVSQNVVAAVANLRRSP